MRLEYTFKGSFKFPNERISKTIYTAIHSDVARENLKGVKIKLQLSGEKIKCEVSSRSFAKFRGFMNTLLRLIRVSEELIQSVEGYEQ